MKKKNLKLVSIIAAFVVLTVTVNAFANEDVRALTSSQDGTVYNTSLTNTDTSNQVGVSESIGGSSSGGTHVNLASQSKDGAILHAFDWSFNQIKNNLSKIADAGYTSVQTSVVQNCPSGSCWWLVYQPTNFAVGNQLGSEQELKDLCAEAEKYGIKIICDVVANHTTARSNGVSSSINKNEFYHGYGPGIDYSNRWQVVQKDMMSGLPDLNTENSQLQNIVKDYLNNLVKDGVDGFRFDGAKHIGLPNDNGGGDFWPNVLAKVNNRDNLFAYGETLQGGADNFSGYQNYMSVTASKYGESVRNAIKNHNVGDAIVSDYCASGVTSDKLVTWVESHDTYENSDGESQNMSSWQVMMGYIICDCRAEGAPLFFNRTTSRGDSATLACVGDDEWENVQVVEANKFRNAMIGQNEYMRKISNDILQIDRGTNGCALICLNGNANINSPTTLADGTYVDHTGINGTFTVSGGILTGNINSGTTAMLYKTEDVVNPTEISISQDSTTFYTDTLTLKIGAKNANSSTYSINNATPVSYTDGTKITIGEDTAYGNTITVTLKATGTAGTIEKKYTYTKKNSKQIENKVYFNKPSDWNTVKIYVYEESNGNIKKVANWPGVSMNSEGNNIYSYTVPSEYTNPQIIFNDGGSKQLPGSNQPGLYLKGIKIYQNGSLVDYIPDEKPISKDIVYFQNTYNWGNVYAYIYDESVNPIKKNSAWPGVKMIKAESNLFGLDNIYSIEVPSDMKNPQVVFNNGGYQQTPSAYQPGYKINGSMILKNGQWLSVNN